MNRPLTRPSRPHDIRTVFDAMVRHFILDAAPQCGEGASCKYSGTGCAVGFMLTKEDAGAWDKTNNIISSVTINSIRNVRPHEYAAYFGEDRRVFLLLRAGQRLHDGVKGFTPEQFTDHMRSGLGALEYCFFE